MIMQARHIDKGYTLQHYASQSLVRCVECNAIGEIKNSLRQGFRRHWQADFQCKHCQLSLSSIDRDWVGDLYLIAQSPCYRCGTKLIIKEYLPDSYKKTLPTTLTTNCSNCDKVNELTVSKCHHYDASLAVDPDFGLPLFLQTPGRFGKVWAYNQNHLTELQTYINASLRETTIQAGNSSMPSRLPDWMKSAKNREMISKKLAQLQKQLNTYQKGINFK